jgi:hypothetical protein
MKIKFKTFHPYEEHDYYLGKRLISSASAINRWLEENPNVEIIGWQTTPVGTTNELYITIQYREFEDA